MIIEANKFYVCRDGTKAYVYSTEPPFPDDGDSKYTVTGVLQKTGNESEYWTEGGHFYSDDETNPKDLVAEWREPAEVRAFVLVTQDGRIVFFHNDRAEVERARDARKKFPNVFGDEAPYGIVYVEGDGDYDPAAGG